MSEEKMGPNGEDGLGYETRVVSYGRTRFIARVRMCGGCGEYRGEMMSPETGEVRPITCICQGSTCLKCKTGRIHRRGTEILNAKGEIWHVPGFASLCEGCQREAEPEWLKDQRAREAALAGTPEGERQAAEKKRKLEEITRQIDRWFGNEEVKGGPYGDG